MTSPNVLLKAWNLRPRKSMGQNFLSDTNLINAIIANAHISEEDVVVEIGAGLGAMTVPLSRKAKQIFAVEPDLEIARLLERELLAANATNVTIIREDFLKCDLGAITGQTTPFKVVGNLPYHISSPILVCLTENRHLLDTAVLMFQKELAERLMADPGTKAYGRLSVLLAYCADIQFKMHIPATAFFPRPKVDSTVLGIRFLHPPPIPARNERFLFQVVRAAFGKRRKMLKNALKSSGLDIEDAVLMHAFESTGIDPGRRAETLTIQDFVQFSDALLLD